jgi:hypothetical protein
MKPVETYKSTLSTLLFIGTMQCEDARTLALEGLKITSKDVTKRQPGERGQQMEVF